MVVSLLTYGVNQALAGSAPGGLSRGAVRRLNELGNKPLNSMTKKGILAGRGYILNEPTYPVVIGPGHADIRNVSQEGGRIILAE